jgi:hypothetical protein
MGSEVGKGMLKFVSKALMSVMLDKDARKKLEDRGPTKKKKSSKKRTRAKKSVPHEERSADPLADDAQAIMEALAEARQMITAPGENLEPTEPVKLHRKLSQRRAGTHKALDQALDSLSEQKRTMTPERQALIQGAVALTKMKAKVLDDLAPEQREKLQAMAVATFSGQVGPPKGRK